MKPLVPIVRRYRNTALDAVATAIQKEIDNDTGEKYVPGLDGGEDFKLIAGSLTGLGEAFYRERGLLGPDHTEDQTSPAGKPRGDGT